ncbi:MAG: class I SAM-dependent methyltransferase [Bacteroidales bacterium]|nr:class I SAM-dependent methyltransferase [Bacteroidales bacterium]
MNLFFSLKHFIKAGYFNGHRVHSPNIFNFFKYSIFSKEKFDYSLAENSYKDFLNSDISIDTLSVGAKGNGEKISKKISNIAKSSSSKGKYGRLLQRSVYFLKPRKILELGTSLGIGTLYMASGNLESKIISLDACTETQKIANNNFQKLNINNIELINSNFDDKLNEILIYNNDIDFVYVDGNHTYESTIKYFKILSENLNQNSVIFFDDINWSKGMTRAWYEILNNKKSIVSIETSRMGIIFLNPKLTPKYYCTRY